MIRTLTWMLVLISACDTEGADAMNPDGMSQPTPRPASQPPGALAISEVRTGTTFDAGSCRVGIIVVAKDTCLLAISGGGANAEQPLTQSYQNLKWGQLMVACGGLYRTVGAKTGGYAVFEKEPVPPPAGVQFRADSLVVQLGQDGAVSTRPSGVKDFSAKVTSIADSGGSAIATVDLEIYVSGHPPGVTTRKETVEVKVGDAVTTTKGKYRVLTIVPPSPEANIPGWVEFDAVPTP